MQRALAGFLILCGISFVALSLWGLYHGGEAGLSFGDGDKPLVTQVAQPGAAAKAGIAVGDRIDLAHMDRLTRYYEVLSSGMPEGTILRIPIIHEGLERTATIVATIAWQDAVSPWKRPISALLIALAGTVLLLRPQRATWAFFAYALILTVQMDRQYLSFPWQGIDDIGIAFTQPWPAVALLLFAVWFLHGQYKRWQRPVTALVVGCAIVLGFVYVYSDIARYIGASFAIPHLDIVRKAWDAALTLLALVVFIETFVTGRRENRQRIAWVIAAFSFAVCVQNVVPNFVDLSIFATRSPLFYFAYAMWSISPLVVAGALLYAMTRYHVVDLRIAVSRALVYGITTFFIVLVFTLIEWAASKIFEGSHVQAYAGVFAVLLIGFAVNSVHQRIDLLVEVIFFRRQRAAERRLRHLAASLLHTDAEETIVKFIVVEPARVLGLASAALFLESSRSSGFERVGSVGWEQGELSRIVRSDEIVPQMRSAERAVRIEELCWVPEHLPRGVEEPVLAVPLKAHGDLFGIVFYGGRSDGALLMPDECDLLNLLTENAAAAYDHIEARRAREEIDLLRAHNAELQARTGQRVIEA